MEIYSSPQLPTTSDPIFDEDWEELIGTAIVPSSTYSDELEALHQVQEESRARKNTAGLVIQHRAWKLGDTFRSEADYTDGL